MSRTQSARRVSLAQATDDRLLEAIPIVPVYRFDPAYAAAQALRSAWRKHGGTEIETEKLSRAAKAALRELIDELACAQATSIEGACEQANLLCGGFCAYKLLDRDMAERAAGSIYVKLERATIADSPPDPAAIADSVLAPVWANWSDCRAGQLPDEGKAEMRGLVTAVLNARAETIEGVRAQMKLLWRGYGAWLTREQRQDVPGWTRALLTRLVEANAAAADFR